MSNNLFYIIKNEFSKRSLAITDEEASCLSAYGDMVLKWNENINLTAITDRTEFVVKHFVDCSFLLPFLDKYNSCSVIDVGTGAGFPGMLLLILCKNIKLTLVDSQKKRLMFLEHACEELSLNADIVHARAEVLAWDESFRDSFDFAASRAVAKLNVLTEFCLPFVKVGGYFLSMKGPGVNKEVEPSQSAIRKLGGVLQDVKSYNLQEDENHSIVSIRKVFKTEKIYPRRSSKIAKIPL